MYHKYIKKGRNIKLLVNKILKVSEASPALYIYAVRAVKLQGQIFKAIILCLDIEFGSVNLKKVFSFYLLFLKT